MVNEVMGMAVKSKSLSLVAAGIAKQTNSKSDTLVLSFRPILRLAGIQIKFLITFYGEFDAILLTN